VSLKYTIIKTIESTMLLVIIMGAKLVSIPYVSQRETLITRNIKVIMLRSFVDFVCHIFITCGRNVMEETIPPNVPTIVAVSIIINIIL
jgi:hypothetical protein